MRRHDNYNRIKFPIQSPWHLFGDRAKNEKKMIVDIRINALWFKVMFASFYLKFVLFQICSAKFILEEQLPICIVGTKLILIQFHFKSLKIKFCWCRSENMSWWISKKFQKYAVLTFPLPCFLWIHFIIIIAIFCFAFLKSVQEGT